MKRLTFLFYILTFSVWCFSCKAQNTPLLYPIRFEGKTGYVNRGYTMVIEPRYDEAHFFSEGYARARLNGKWVLINPEGTVVRRFDVELKGDLHNGYIVFEKGNTLGFIDHNGKVLMSGFAAARDFSEGMAAVKIERGWTYLKKKGGVITGKIFKGAYDFHEGLATVIDESGWMGVIDNNGNYIIDPQYSSMSRKFSEGLCYAAWYRVPDNNHSGYINKKGELIIPKVLNSWTSFCQGKALVAVGHNPRPLFWSLIDRTGKVLIERVNITNAEDFYEGITVVERDIGSESKEGYMDNTGKMLVEPQFDKASPFSQGIGIGYDNDKQVAFVDQQGNITWVKDIIAQWKDERK